MLTARHAHGCPVLLPVPFLVLWSILVLAHLLRRPCSCHGVRRDRPPSRAHMDRSTTVPTRVPGAAAPRASAPRAPGLTTGPSNPGPLADASGCLGPALGPEDKG
ncbi:hypothetical protein OC844_006443 [Tilletia horrida]|nr:hypothetical protein OC844_006443 [Tilletia horrida]